MVSPTTLALAAAALGLGADIPLDVKEMAHSLTVTFLPPHQDSPSLRRFVQLLKDALTDSGANVIPYREALVPGNKERVRPGVVIVEQGEGSDTSLAINRVSSLYDNPLMAVYDKPCPAIESDSLQHKLDAIVAVLARNMTHIAIFVNEGTWTLAVMNGAIVQCGSIECLRQKVATVLVPKLVTQVRPPRPEQIVFQEGALEVESKSFIAHANDFVAAARVWRSNGLMLAHTDLDDLVYRNKRFRKIVSAYLDNRTGLAYGFMARQLPISVRPAVRLHDAGAAFHRVNWDRTPIFDAQEKVYARINLAGETVVSRCPRSFSLMHTFGLRQNKSLSNSRYCKDNP